MFYRYLSTILLCAPVFALLFRLDVPTETLIMSLFAGIATAFVAVYIKLDEICKLLKDKNNEEEDAEKKEEED